MLAEANVQVLHSCMLLILQGERREGAWRREEGGSMEEGGGREEGGRSVKDSHCSEHRARAPVVGGLVKLHCEL